MTCCIIWKCWNIWEKILEVKCCTLWTNNFWYLYHNNVSAPKLILICDLFFYWYSHFFWPKLILYTCSSSTILLIWSAPCRHFLLPKLKSILKRWCRQLKSLKKNSRTDLHIILKESYLVASMSKKCIKKLQNYLNRPCNLIKLTENSAFQGIQKYQLQLIFKNVSLLIILL